jgi:hypothetical protein
VFKFTVYSSKIDGGFRVVAGDHAPMREPQNWRVSVFEGLTRDAAAMAAYACEHVERIREQILQFVEVPALAMQGEFSRQAQAITRTSLAKVLERRHLGGLKRTKVVAGPGRPKAKIVYSPCPSCKTPTSGKYCSQPCEPFVVATSWTACDIDGAK